MIPARDPNLMEQFVVYRPTTKDLKGFWVVRRFVICADGYAPDERPCALNDTLEGAREAIHSLRPGLFRLPRQEGDDPVIEEVWI